MQAKKLEEILKRQYRHHERMKMTLDDRVREFVKATVRELENAGLQLEREPDIDVLDFPRVLAGALDEMEEDEIEAEEIVLIEKVRDLIKRVKGAGEVDGL